MTFAELRGLHEAFVELHKTNLPKPPAVTEADLKTNNDGHRLVRIADAAAFLNISPWKIRQLCHRGKLAFIQDGKTSPLLFDPNELCAYIQREMQKKG
jgi:hypothetical protein